jgi:hypothetical protein
VIVAFVWRGYSCEAESRPCGLALLVVHHTKTLFCVAASQEKAARNDPKCHYSGLYRSGVFALMVAQPIQDVSALSITHKAVGVRLPRLWCRAQASGEYGVNCMSKLISIQRVKVA